MGSTNRTTSRLSGEQQHLLSQTTHIVYIGLGVDSSTSDVIDAGLTHLIASRWSVERRPLSLCKCGDSKPRKLDYHYGHFPEKLLVTHVDLSKPYKVLMESMNTASDDRGKREQIEKPRLVVGQMGTPNAFAVGRKGAGVVVVSETLLALVEEGYMSLDELEGVLAHELAHVKNRDVVMLLLGQSIVSIVGLTVFFVVDLVADEVPLVGFLISWMLSVLAQMLVMVFVLAISPSGSMSLAPTRPNSLATRTRSPALSVIHDVGSLDEAADVDSAMASMCIFGGERGRFGAIFSTHPAMEKRVKRLQAMADQ